MWCSIQVVSFALSACAASNLDRIICRILNPCCLSCAAHLCGPKMMLRIPPNSSSFMLIAWWCFKPGLRTLQSYESMLFCFGLHTCAGPTQVVHFMLSVWQCFKPGLTILQHYRSRLSALSVLCNLHCLAQGKRTQHSRKQTENQVRWTGIYSNM